MRGHGSDMMGGEGGGGGMLHAVGKGVELWVWLGFSAQPISLLSGAQAHLHKATGRHRPPVQYLHALLPEENELTPSMGTPPCKA